MAFLNPGHADRCLFISLCTWWSAIALSGLIQNLQFNKMARESEKNEISPLKTKKNTASRPNNKFFEFSFKYSQFL